MARVGDKVTHDLPGELIVNLTSYPPRFPTLHLTIQSLLDQSVRADRTILWVSEDEAHHLPRKVRALQKNASFEIRTTENLRSYKKLVPALAAFPDSFHVIADDDVFYDPSWLAELVETWQAAQRDADAPIIACHRAHRFPRQADAVPAYQSWEWDVQADDTAQGSASLIPTGVGGVLYPPRSLHPDVMDKDAFRKLAPTADDLWFYWMARRAGSKYVKTARKFVLMEWPGTRENGLAQVNASQHGNANDEQVAKLLAHYGHPLAGSHG
jgi:hypothetical protein